MKYIRKDYEEFLSTELKTLQNNYLHIVNSKALLLKGQGKIFVGKYIKVDENGIAIFKIRKSDNMPRKGSFWTASFLIGEMGSFKNWNQNTWAELRESYQKSYSNAYCAWISKSDSPDFCLIGIKRLTVAFIEQISEGQIVAFGPEEPPAKYLINLLDLVTTTNHDSEVGKLLYFQPVDNQWSPIVIDSQKDFSEIIQRDLNYRDCIIIQGPPGTGKTYKIAQLISKLISDNKSVLVTALTNRALMELALKDSLATFVNKGRVSKTSLTIDERTELKNISAIQNDKCVSRQGHLSLATFYIASGWAAESDIPPFDYVIMDEASQALLPMIAGARKLGKKVVWLGDQCQLAPIVLTAEDIIKINGWSHIVKGFDTICNYIPNRSYFLCDTYRLNPRAASFTSFFYQNNLRSVSTYTIPFLQCGIFNKDGGPTLIPLNLKIGDKYPQNGIDKAIEIATSIYEEYPDAKVAILSKFTESVRKLQKHFIISAGYTEIPENIIIETVDKIQGLTVDFCIYFIPNASIKYSLEKELFNVATSRARYCTLIITDLIILKSQMDDSVRKYFLKMLEDKCAIS